MSVKVQEMLEQLVQLSMIFPYPYPWPGDTGNVWRHAGYHDLGDRVLLASSGQGMLPTTPQRTGRLHGKEDPALNSSIVKAGKPRHSSNLSVGGGRTMKAHDNGKKEEKEKGTYPY